MFVEIITIGDELLIGQVIDTNSAWMGIQLNQAGFEVIRKTAVRDVEEEILSAFSDAMERAQIVLVTGGLGPTKDDITKKTLCKFFNTELIFNNLVYENVKRLLHNRVAMNQLNCDQALVPKSCTVIPNRVGTASVSWFEENGKVLISMPGVPEEMRTVMTEEIIPRLSATYVTDSILHHTYAVKEYAESILAEKIASWEEALPAEIKLAYLPQPNMIRLRLTARGADPQQLATHLHREGSTLKTILGSAIFQETTEKESEKSLPELVAATLCAKKRTLSTAESCTGGAIAATLTALSGASTYFKGSIVAYDNEIKKELLHVSNTTLLEHGAVSEEVVIEMVKGALKTTKSDYAVATSGIAGPTGGTETKPVGLIWVAAGTKDKVITKLYNVDRGRETNIKRAVNGGLLLLLELLEQE